MSTVSLRLPDSLHHRVNELAKDENISINQFITLAVAEKLSTLKAAEYLEKRANRGSRKKFESVLARVPDLALIAGDEL